MADDSIYGVDVQALDDLPDPEVLCSGTTNVAYALGRRLAQDPDAQEELGDTDEYDAFNVEDYLGADYDLTDPTTLDEIRQRCTQVLSKDPRAAEVSVDATFAGGTLGIKVKGSGSAGPFSFVLTVDGILPPAISDIQP